MNIEDAEEHTRHLFPSELSKMGYEIMDKISRLQVALGKQQWYNESAELYRVKQPVYRLVLSIEQREKKT